MAPKPARPPCLYFQLQIILTRAVIHMQLCRHVIDMRKSCRCRHKEYFTTYIYMLFQSMVFGNTWETTKSCQTSQEIRLLLHFAGHLLYYGCNVRCTYRFVVYPGSFFVLWILMNQSIQSPHPEVGMVSLLYDSATEHLTVFVQNFKSYYMLICRRHVRIFLPICRHEKQILMTALMFTIVHFV